MRLLVLFAIAYVPTQALVHNYANNGTTNDDVPEAYFNNTEGTISSLNVNQHMMKTHRNCTSKDQYCMPICCEPVLHRNRSACYAMATFSLVQDIDFSAIRSCNLSALSMSPERRIANHEMRYELDSDSLYEIAFYLLDNGTIYETTSMNEDHQHWLDLDDYYCLTTRISEDGTKSVEAVCFPHVQEKSSIAEKINIIYVSSTVLSLPFLAVTFVACMVLPKFKNMHGLTLRAYVGSLFVMFVSLIIPNFAKEQLCSTLVFITYFTSLACFSWVNVMSFDIWRTFRRYRSIQTNKKQSDRKKCMIYSTFAWGSATILTIICASIDNLPYIPDNFIKPNLGRKACCVFGSPAARGLYFYLPTGLSVICNVYLFASSIKTIDRQRKEIAQQLEGVDSRCHNENKERFNFAVKLCTMMIINWTMEIINCLCERDSLQYFWAIMDLTNVLQGIVIFIIFVWTEETKAYLLKYLGFSDKSINAKNSQLKTSMTKTMK